MLPVFTIDQIAHQLSDEGHGFFGETRQKLAVFTGDTVTYDVSDMNEAGRAFALAALDIWSSVTGLIFDAVEDDPDIRFVHGTRANRAFSTTTNLNSGGDTSTIVEARITISQDWFAEDWSRDGADGALVLNYASYGMSTFVHEIGHTLGLAHAGNYNRSADYPDDAHYSNDSWQMSIMSYFNQVENTSVDASLAIPLTPMIADIVAIQDLYGVPLEAQSGDTTYGLTGTTGTYLDSLFVENALVAATLFDTGGHDTIDMSHIRADQKIDLNTESISDVAGLRGNLILARGTDIEDAKSGAGDDLITGNALSNALSGGAGNDTIEAGSGNDEIMDGLGNNAVNGGTGHDKIVLLSGSNEISGGAGSDFLIGGLQADKLSGGTGNDVILGDVGRGIYGGSDRIEGRTGEDTLMGGAGGDTFVFHTNDGNDVIANFEITDVIFDPLSGYSTSSMHSGFQFGIDKIELNGFSTVTSANVLSHVTDTADGARFDAEGTSILLFGHSVDQLSGDDFLFV